MNGQLINISEIYETNNECPIINLSEIWFTITQYPKYELRLASTVRNNYFSVSKDSLLENLNKHLTNNLNYIILQKLNHIEENITLYLTPIVKSA